MADLQAATGERVILGSASPRRAELLTRLDVAFVVKTVDIDEAALVNDADATTSVRQIALAKFAAFDTAGNEAVDSPQTLITADTLVMCDGAGLGKPDSDAAVPHMLRRMSGAAIDVVTAVCTGRPGRTPEIRTVTTHVQLHPLEPAAIDAYVRTGAGLDKAGALALQAEANDFIAAVDGCWSNVVGLPLCAVAAALDLAPHGQTQAQRCSVALCGSWRLERR